MSVTVAVLLERLRELQRTHHDAFITATVRTSAGRFLADVEAVRPDGSGVELVLRVFSGPSDDREPRQER